MSTQDSSTPEPVIVIPMPIAPATADTGFATEPAPIPDSELSPRTINIRDHGQG